MEDNVEPISNNPSSNKASAKDYFFAFDKDFFKKPLTGIYQV